MSEEKAKEYIALAEKAKKKFLFWGPNYETAAENFASAANQYKMLKNWSEAGEIYKKIADCRLALNSSYEAATSFVDAANCFKKEDTDKAIESFKEAVILYSESGKFASAAKIEKELAELYESQMNTTDALEHYQKAADLFESEESQQSSSQCLIKVAALAAAADDFKLASEIYEKVARGCLEKNILKFNAKGYLFNAGICVLCIADTVLTKEKLELYKDMDYTFASSREYKLLENVTEDIENQDEESFSEHIFDFDQISPFDAWKTSMFLKIKNQVTQEDDSLDLT